MDIDSALKVADGEDIRNRCHVNSNEDGDRFVTVYNDAVLIISLENQQLKFDILAGTPYFVDMNLNLTE